MQVKGQTSSCLKYWGFVVMVFWFVSLLVHREATCTYVITEESSCDESDLLDVVEVNTIEECQQACTDYPGCFVTAISIPICQLYPANTLPVSFGDWTYMERVFTGG